MRFITKLNVCCGMVIVSLVIGTSVRAAENLPVPPEPTTIAIGMPKTLFQGLHESLMHVGAAPFLRMMKGQTGIDGTIHFPADSVKLAEMLHDGKIQIAVMPGYEFAYAKLKYPDLEPIAVAAPMQPIQSFVLVKWDCKAAHIGDLKDQKISLPSVHRDYCEVFLCRQKDQYMKGQGFSGQLSRPFVDDAIFDVIEERAGCTVVDCAALKYFERVNPGQFTNLKVLCQSELYPNACIVVKKGELDPKTIAKFNKALVNAETDPIGRPMLSTWKLKGFTAVPSDYDQQLQSYVKIYPPPAAWQVTADK